jgi:hypothetical protein
MTDHALVRGSRGVGGGREGEGDRTGAGGVTAGDALADFGADSGGIRRCACHTWSRRKISRSAKSTVLNLASFAEMPDDFSTQRVYAARSSSTRSLISKVTFARA